MAHQVDIVREEFQGEVTCHESHRGYLAKVLYAFGVHDWYLIITDNEVPENYYRIHGEGVSGFFIERELPNRELYKKILNHSYGRTRLRE